MSICWLFLVVCLVVNSFLWLVFSCGFVYVLLVTSLVLRLVWCMIVSWFGDGWVGLRFDCGCWINFSVGIVGLLFCLSIVVWLFVFANSVVAGNYFCWFLIWFTC